MVKTKGLILSVFLLLCAPLFFQASAQESNPPVIVLTANGALTPATVEYLNRGIQVATYQNATLLILQLNTPGGNVNLMNDMVRSIRASSVPILVFVTPAGAIAGSAGTIITLAGHLAAMSPETAIGAASPVGSQGEDIGKTEESKIKEIMKATARSLADRRGLIATKLAEDTIEYAKAVTSREALESNLIDFIAEDITDLLSQVDGVNVNTASGLHTLKTNSPRVIFLKTTFIEQMLDILTDPNIVFLLLTLGLQAILIELSNPGGWIPGFFGVVSLAFATYGLGILPVNWFGLAFIATAFVLFILDIKAPTHGALTVAGVASFITGALILFNSPATPQFQRVSIPLVVISSLLSAAVFTIAITFAIRAQETPVLTGHESLVGKTGFATSDIAPKGNVQLGGERWSAILAQGETSIQAGEHVQVVGVTGLTLHVRAVIE